MTLAADEFIRRFLQHTVPDGFHRIRHIGFLANRHRTAKLALCCDLLAAPPPPDPHHGEEMRWQCWTALRHTRLARDLGVPRPRTTRAMIDRNSGGQAAEAPEVGRSRQG